MEQSKLFGILLSDPSIGNAMNQSRKSRQQTACVRVSRRISNMQGEIKEVKSESFTKETKVQTKKMKTSQDDDKSDYEKMIEENRAKSLAFLESLKLDEVKGSFFKSVHDLKPKKKHNIKRPAGSSNLRSIRKRLVKKDLDLSEDAVRRRAISEALEKPSGTLKPTVLLPFEEALKSSSIFSKFVHDYSELEWKTERSYEFMSHMKDMKTCPSQIAKVLPGRITAVSIHPVRDKIIICASGKLGHVGFWNMNSDSIPYIFAPHIDGVSNIKFNPYDFNQVISSSYDGTLCCGDMEKLVFDKIYSVSNKICCTYFDVLSKTTFIVAHRNGEVALVDKRASKISVKVHSSDNCSVRSVCVHPLNKNYFISSQINGSIRLWDLRTLRKKPVSDVRHHKKCVTSAFFSPATGKSILSTSLDDSIGIFDSSELSENISLKKSIKHRNKSNFLPPFQAIWVPYTDDMFVVGSFLYPRRIEVFNDNLNNIHNFMDEDFGSITSLHAFHPSLPVLAGGNGTGRVCVYTDTA